MNHYARAFKIFLILYYVFSVSLLCLCGYADDYGNFLWSFVAYSDSHGSNPIHREILSSIAKIKPDLILGLGDILFHGSESGTFESFKRDVSECYGNYDDFVKIFYPAIGGHEERYYNKFKFPPNGREPDNESGRKFYDEVSLRERVENFNENYGDYHFVHKGINFIALYRTDEWRFKDQQVNWLELTLKKIPKEQPIVVFAHGGGWFLPNPFDANQTAIRYLLSKYKVDLALGGDWHDFYVLKEDAILMFRTGSAGKGDTLFLRFDVTDKGFIIKALEPDGVTPFTKHQNLHPCWFKPFAKDAIKIDCK